MFCKYCGQELPDGSGFCSKCGRSLTAKKPGFDFNVKTPAAPAVLVAAMGLVLCFAHWPPFGISVILIAVMMFTDNAKLVPVFCGIAALCSLGSTLMVRHGFTLGMNLLILLLSLLETAPFGLLVYDTHKRLGAGTADKRWLLAPAIAAGTCALGLVFNLVSWTGFVVRYGMDTGLVWMLIKNLLAPAAAVVTVYFVSKWAAGYPVRK